MYGQRASTGGRASIGNNLESFGLSSVSSTLDKLRGDERRHETLIKDLAQKDCMRRTGIKNIVERHTHKSFADSDYVFVKTLGKGRHGEMKLAKRKANEFVKHQLGTPGKTREKNAVSRFVAVRIIRRYGIRGGRVSENDQIAPKKHAALLRYIEGLRRLDHPNIQREIESFEDSQNVFVVMELYTGPKLLDKLQTPLSEMQAAWIIKQVVSGIAHAHSVGIVHQDIRPDNIMYASADCDARIVITDWACLEFLDTNPSESRKDLIFSDFSAPELEADRRTDKADMWSIGVTAFVLLTLKFPFGPNQERDFEWSPDDPVLSSDCRDLIGKLLKRDPVNRPSAQEAMFHPWLAKAAPAVEPQHLTLSLESAGCLARFRERSVLQRTAASIAVEHLTGEKLHELTQVFQSLDRDGDGKITKEDMLQCLRDSCAANQSSNVGDKQADDMDDIQDLLDDSSKISALVGLLDPDADGKITYTDFLTAAAESCFEHSVDLAWEAFRSFDLSHSGSITKKEMSVLLDSPVMDEVLEAQQRAGLKRTKTKDDLAKAFKALGDAPKSTEDCFKELDDNNDGRITFEEFLKAMSE